MSRNKKPARTASRIVRHLIEIADKSGKTYAEIAAGTGMTLYNLSYWKHGHRSPRLCDFELFAESLGYRLTFEEIEPCLL